MNASLEEAQKESDFYCPTRDVFEARNDKTPEMGNNSFDHNLANWPNIAGVFFGVEYDGKNGIAIIADRGLGVLNTLRKAAPDLANDQEALQLAFTKKISSRVFENRGNGLKFVKNNIMANDLRLDFQSGKALAAVNHGLAVSYSENTISGCIAKLNF
jgi:hypothetical protein